MWHAWPPSDQLSLKCLTPRRSGGIARRFAPRPTELQKLRATRISCGSHWINMHGSRSIENYWTWWLLMEGLQSLLSLLFFAPKMLSAGTPIKLDFYGLLVNHIFREPAPGLEYLMYIMFTFFPDWLNDIKWRTCSLALVMCVWFCIKPLPLSLSLSLHVF